MKVSTSAFKRLLFILYLMIIFHYGIDAQESDSIRSRQRGLFIGLTLGASQSQIVNEGMLSVSGLINGKSNGMTGSAEVGYSFSEYFGISSGISYSSVHGEVTLNSYQNKFNTVDSENETYERQVSGTNITEKQNIDLLGIPVFLNFRFPFNKRIGFSIRTGIDMVFPIVKNYHSGGTFTYKGYYPKYNVLLENLPAYGFPTNANIATNGGLALKPLCFDASASAGFDMFIKRNLQAAIAFYYTKSLSSILAYDSPEKFRLSTDVDQINSMMGGSSKSTIQSMGLSITLRYYLPRR